jgi:hypothetical protein
MTVSLIRELFARIPDGRVSSVRELDEQFDQLEIIWAELRKLGAPPVELEHEYATGTALHLWLRHNATVDQEADVQHFYDWVTLVRRPDQDAVVVPLFRNEGSPEPPR